MIGQGGFGCVYKVQDRLDLELYAVKKVRIHLLKTDDLSSEIRNHKVFREIQALAKKNFELQHTVRYYNSWLEELSIEEQQAESDKLV